MKVLIAGATGMLGSAMFRRLAADPALEVTGTLRGAPEAYPALATGGRLVGGVSIDSDAEVAALLSRHAPAVTINCVGERRQPANAGETAALARVNAEWPHRLAALVAASGGRLVHFSTDGVFAGTRGGYRESDAPDADDPYGRAKLAGEVTGAGCLTLRTSLIGHSLDRRSGLVDWLLAQDGAVKGYTGAIFSGLPTVELADIVHRHILPNPELGGLYHVAAEPISKFELLRRIARRYGSAVEVLPDDGIPIDRSLDSSRFRAATGYRPPDWDVLIDRMYLFG